jgi:vesicle coat complex subunit
MIRGLALRSLCSLRVKNLVEYLVGPLKTAIRDSNPYVRTMAAMGILKLYYLAPAACKDAELVPALKRLLMNDPDPQVQLPPCPF